jgi:predicted RND superfamily exporter protein
MLQATDPPMLATLREYPEIASLALPAPDRAKGRGEAIAAVFLSTVLDDRAARDRAIEVIRDALAGVPEATLTGLSVVGRDLEEQIKTDLSQSMWIADVMVLGCLLLYFRSVKYALLAAIPPAFAALLLYAGMQVLGIRLNLVNLVGLPLLVGIGVDNGVFLTSLVAGGDDSQPLIERMGAATHAITMTTLTTVLTFGSLLLTSTPAIRSLGILMGIGVTAALVGALGLLCPILVGQRARGFVRGED